MEIYDHPRYYDIGFGWDLTKERNFLEGSFRRYCPFPVKTVLELGCGTGRLLIGLAKRGYRTVGVEISRPMIDYALSKSLQAGADVQIVESNMANFSLPEKVDAAFCAIDTFRYLLTEEAALSHLSCVGETLRPGGVYVIDFGLVGLTSSYPKRDVEEWTCEREEVSVTVAHRVIGVPDLQNRRTIERTTLTVNEKGVIKKVETEDPMRTYTRSEFESLVESSRCFQILAWHSPDFSLQNPVTPRPETERVIAVLGRL